jgi:hypothetical protein
MWFLSRANSGRRFPFPSWKSLARLSSKEILAQHGGDFDDFWLTADGDWSMTFDAGATLIRMPH